MLSRIESIIYTIYINNYIIMLLIFQNLNYLKLQTKGTKNTYLLFFLYKLISLLIFSIVQMIATV
jgi:hypothetical protein